MCNYKYILPLCEGVEDTCGSTGDDDDGDSEVVATNKTKKARKARFNFLECAFVTWSKFRMYNSCMSLAQVQTIPIHYISIEKL